MSTFQNILQIKCQTKGHTHQTINEYMKDENTLKPMCFNCKLAVKQQGEYYMSMDINQQLEMVLFEIKKIIEVRQEVMKTIKQFRESINKKLDECSNSLESDFDKIINHEQVKKIKEYYEKEQPVHEPSKHIVNAITFLKFDNNKIDKSEFTIQLFKQKEITSRYSQKLAQLCKLIQDFSFESSYQPNENHYKQPDNPINIKIQQEVRQVQICQQIEKNQHSSVSTFNKKHCLTITPYKSFCLTALWISMLADQAQKPLLNIRIYKNTKDNQIQEFNFHIDDKTPVTNDKYKVDLENQCELLEGNKYSILIDHPKQFSCLSAEFYKCNYTKTNTFFEIVEGFINQDEKQIINQIEEGLICDLELLI